MSDDADAPDVDTLIVGLLPHDLGRHVQRRAEHLPEATLRPVETREAKVGQLQIDLATLIRFLGCQQYVLRFYIAMHDILPMHIVERQEKLLDNVSCLLLVDPLHFDDVFVELAAGHQFCDDVEASIVLQKLKDPHYMRMISLRQDVQLLLHEVDQDLVLADVLLTDGLDGASNAGLQVDALSHLAEAALAEDAAHFVLLAHIRCLLQALEQTELKQFLSQWIDGLTSSCQSRHVTTLGSDSSHFLKIHGRRRAASLSTTSESW